MANLNSFDATTVEPNAGFDPIPAGKYVCVVTNSEMKPTRAGDGEYLQLELEVIEGEHKGRRLWDRLVLKHPNPTTVQIAKGTLSALCRAVNVLQPKDSVELHNLPVKVSVGVKRRDDNGELANTIKGYSGRGSAGSVTTAAPASAPGATQGAIPGAVGATAAPESTPPWRR